MEKPATKVDVFTFRFDAKSLRNIPSQYLGYLIASSHCCNELSILLPYLIYEHELGSTNEPESAFILFRTFTIQRTIISKLVEYGELSSDFFGRGNSSDEITKHLKTLYEPISQQLKSAKWARILRNKISFHFDSKHALDSLNKLPDGHPLRLFAGRIKGLTLLEFAEEIVGRPIYEAAGTGDIGKGMEVTQELLISAVNAITKFNSEMAILLFRQFNVVAERTQGEIREQFCGVPGEIKTPIAISASYLASRMRVSNRK